MPSPFPDMDPDLEAQPECWPEFYFRLVVGIADVQQFPSYR